MVTCIIWATTVICGLHLLTMDRTLTLVIWTLMPTMWTPTTIIIAVTPSLCVVFNNSPRFLVIYYYMIMKTQYDCLPVYQNCFELLIRICNTIHSFPREYKYTFWEYLQKFVAESLSEISLATMIWDISEKSLHIENARKQMELLKLYRRVCKEINILSNNNYIQQLESIISISKQINWRLNFCNNKANNHG